MKNRSFRSATILQVACLLVGAVHLQGQIGNDNPTGTAGQFNGNVNTAGSYDPYTGNATRSVTDLAVAGGVSSYPLALSRIHNSRFTGGVNSTQFGSAGNWRHSYQWTIDPITIVKRGYSAMPASYPVNYPDGRRILFTSATPYFKAPGGVGDRFKAPLASGPSDCYLLLADGGRVWFEAQINREEIGGGERGDGVLVSSTFTFTLKGIIDPEGRITTISYPPDGTMTITDPTGLRWLKLFYGSAPNGEIVVDHVTASDGRSVQYQYYTLVTPGNFSYAALNYIVYFNDPQIVAIYGYQFNNTDPDGRPLLSTAIDCMYGGPMWAISYTYVPGSTGVASGQLQSENYLDPSTGLSGPAVSTLSASGNTRTETRGDGPSRTFTYSAGRLVSYTDFKGVSSSQGYDANGFVNSLTDRRGYATDLQIEGMTGKVTRLTHPLTPFDGGIRPTVQTVYGSPSCPDPNNRDGNNPYYPYSVKDERNNTTFFLRDPSRRITQINYPNTAYETFSYNNFGQVLTHRMTSGGTETFTYNSRSLKDTYTPPATPSDPNPVGHPTRYFYYESGPNLDRLMRVEDPKGLRTWYEYNARGQVTKVTYENADYLEFFYDNHGDRIWIYDELRHLTVLEYDYYKRVTKMTDPLNHSTIYYYGRNWSDPYLHTTSNLKGVFSPLGKNVHINYDENWQRALTREPTVEVDAWTYFGYDGAGNLASVTDPKGYVRTYAYDQRNRRTSTTDPAPFSSQITAWEYDSVGNMTKETRPDTAFQRMEYDSMNRVSDSYGFGGEHIHYDRDLAGNIYQMVDPKNAIYSFGYDVLNRKTSATYPLDAANMQRSEFWHFDWNGNMDGYQNPAGNYKHLAYDARNRNVHSFWDGQVWSVPDPNVGQDTTTLFDSASRVTQISTNNNATVVAFGYDDANRQVSEDQTYNGVTRHIATPRDADGNRSSLGVTGWYAIAYDYTGRNQLKHIYDGAGTTWFTYSYDPNGNLTRRQDNMWNINQSTKFQFDELNRTTIGEQALPGESTDFARSRYYYDVNSRLQYTTRDESGKGDRFAYDSIGQLTNAWYNADQVWTSNPLNAIRTVSYNLDALNRTGNNAVNENGMLTAYTPNAVNQYNAVGGSNISYDNNFNLSGWGAGQYVYDADKRLRGVTLASSSQDLSTGRYSSGGTVPDGAADPRWSVRWPGASSDVPAYVTYQGWPIPPWMVDTASSKWISPIAAESSSSDPAGYYVYTLTFQIDGSATGYQISGSTATDDGLMSATLNGQPVSLGSMGGFAGWTPLTITSGFQSGTNVLRLTVGNAGSGPSGLRAELALIRPPFNASFVYDGLGRCVARTIRGVTTTLAYDGWKPVVEWDGGGNLLAWNIYGAGADEILWRYHVSYGHLRYLSDRMGNVMFLMDGNGNALEKYTYDAFGQPTVTNWDGSGARTYSNYGNRFMFTGREWLSQLGIYDYRNRMYQPQLGRFLQPDPTGFAAGDANLFRYCGGDPVNSVDPSGLVASGSTIPLRPNEPKGPAPVYNGQGQPLDPGGPGRDSNAGVGDRVTVGWPGGTGAWGDAWDGGFDHLGGHGTFGPNDHGFGGGVGDGGGGGGSGPEPPKPNAGVPGGAGGPTGTSVGGEATLGDLFDYGRLRGELTQYGREHQADLSSTAQFGTALYIGASVYSIAGLAGIATSEAIVLDSTVYGTDTGAEVVFTRGQGLPGELVRSRIAPFGNRGAGPWYRQAPHYHRRPGIGKHRPYEGGW